MKKLLFVGAVLALSVQSQAITNYTYYWNVSLTGDTATVKRMKANYDTVKNWTGRLVDTLNTKVPRFSSVLRNHDSTYTYMKIDSIRSNPDIDSAKIGVLTGLNVMRGDPDIDSAAVGVLHGLNVMRGNPDVDSITGRPLIDSTETRNLYVGPDQDSTPDYRLEIGARMSADDGLRITYQGLTNEGLSLIYNNSGNTTGRIDSWFDDAAAEFRVRMRTAGTPVNALTVLGSGNVGVMTTNPASPLTVKGNLLDSGNVTATGKFVGDTMDGSWTVGDSLRIGAGNWLSNYSYGSAACTLSTLPASSFRTGTFSTDTVGTVAWERIGNQISIVFTGFDVTVDDSGNGGGCKVNNFPVALIPNASSHIFYATPVGVYSANGELWLLVFHNNGNDIVSLVSFYPTNTYILFNAEAAATYKYK